MTGERMGAGSGTAGWLLERDGDTPASLREQVRDAVTRVEHADPDGVRSAIPHGLVTAAVESLERALSIGGDRAAATPLLAADALLTYAVEAAARSGDTLDAVSADVHRRLARLIDG